MTQRVTGIHIGDGIGGRGRGDENENSAHINAVLIMSSNLNMSEEANNTEDNSKPNNGEHFNRSNISGDNNVVERIPIQKLSVLVLFLEECH